MSELPSHGHGITLPDTDYAEHNEEARTVCAAYRAGRPSRVPVTLWADPRFFILDHQYNPGGAHLGSYAQPPHWAPPGPFPIPMKETI